MLVVLLSKIFVKVHDNHHSWKYNRAVDWLGVYFVEKNNYVYLLVNSYDLKWELRYC